MFLLENSTVSNAEDQTKNLPIAYILTSIDRFCESVVRALRDHATLWKIGKFVPAVLETAIGNELSHIQEPILKKLRKNFWYSKQNTTTTKYVL